jgi:hypothetical protein
MPQLPAFLSEQAWLAQTLTEQDCCLTRFVVARAVTLFVLHPMHSFHVMAEHRSWSPLVLSNIT